MFKENQPLRARGLQWFRANRLTLSEEIVSVSKHYSGKESWNGQRCWWFEIALTKVQTHQDAMLNLLCENPESGPEFIHLRLPMANFLCANSQFHFRDDVQRFSLILSAEARTWLHDLRGPGKIALDAFQVMNG